jgi:uncharacterized protein YutE (UPF0331/DUF86 family)/predicted nucleotidyltransferase
VDDYLANISEKLQEYFERRDDVAFAYIFGSIVSGRAAGHSDVDLAVYFYPQQDILDIEEDIDFLQEDDLWADVERLCNREVDLIVLNRAPATVAAAAMLTGKPLAINDGILRWKYFCKITDLAEEYREFVKDYLEIKSRSLSLSEIDKDRLLRILDFLTSELKDCNSFKDINLDIYIGDSAFRRNVERWIENLVNASIDIAKILISSNKEAVPQTYREIVLRLGSIDQFSKENIKKLSSNTRLRNVLAHEYLDVKYKRISEFVSSAEDVYLRLLESTKKVIESIND